MDEEAERMIIWERLPQLLQGPLRAGVIGDIDVEDLTWTQFHEHEYIKDTESGCDHDEEVAGYDRLGVISYEGQPALARVGISAGTLGQILADRARRDSHA
jgi:hypothetical protein